VQLKKINQKRGIVFEFSTDTQLVFRVFCHDLQDPDHLTPGTNITIFWTGSALSNQCVEMFDRMRSFLFRRDNFTFSLVTAKGVVSLDNGDTDLFEEGFVLRDDATPLLVPQGTDQLKLDFYGSQNLSQPEPGMLPALISDRVMNVSFWGRVYEGPSPPNSPNDVVGVFSNAQSLNDFHNRLVDYIERTQYSTASRSDVELLLQHCWAQFRSWN